MREHDQSKALQEQPKLYFDLFAGQLLVGEEAYITHIEAGAQPEDVYELPVLLRSNDIPINSKEYPQYKGRDKQEFIIIGHFLSNLPHKEDEAPLDRNMLIRASQLGLSPGIAILRHNEVGFGSLSAFYQALALRKVRRRGLFKKWSQDQHAEHIKNIVETKKYNSILDSLKEAAEEGSTPTINMIRGSYKSVGRLLERSGYVVRTRSGQLSAVDCVDWGVWYRHANGELPTQLGIDVLSSKKRGPSRRTVAKFYPTLDAFRKAVSEEFEREEETHARIRQNIVEALEKETCSGAFPVDLHEIIQNEDELISVYSRYKVINKLLPELPEKYKRQNALIMSPALFVAAIQRANPAILEGRIEEAAVSLDVFDFIWPLNGHLEYMKITPKEFEARRRKRRKGKK